MDPTLLQQPPPFDFSIPSESKYLGGQERPFSNQSFSNHGYSYSSRRPQSSLTNGASGAGVALPANSSLDFNGTSLLNEPTPYHSGSQLLLSPPDSVTGSGAQPTSSVHYSTTLPKPFPSNVGTTEHYSSAPPPVLSSNWSGPLMTGMDRPRFPPQPLSPPLSYNPASGVSGLLANRPMIDRLGHSYQANGQSLSGGIFQHGHHRFPSGNYHRSSLSHPYPMAEPSYAGQNIPSPFQDNTGPTRADGPPFGDTMVLHQVIGGHSQHLEPDISAGIQKGFFQVDRKWTCYRRNYFAVSCSFSWKGQFAEGPFYLERSGQREVIHQFAVSISAKTAVPNTAESEARALVQYTPKRDKATESTPGRHSICPTPHGTMNVTSLFHGTGSMYSSTQHIAPSVMGSYTNYDSTTQNPLPPNHTFERIQFQKATANNGKRRAQQQYFSVVVELSVNVARNHGAEDWVVIAMKESDPVVVRGRSPGHYRDNARSDSQTSMDPDRGNGSGEGHQAPVTANRYGSTSVDWHQTSHRHSNSGSYGHRSYRQVTKLHFSPAYMPSPTNLAEGSTEVELGLSDSQTAKSSCTFSSDPSSLTPLSNGSDDVLFGDLCHSTGRKRPYEDESEEVEKDEHLNYHVESPFAEGANALADLSLMSYSKLLCASS